MADDLAVAITVFVLASFVGHEVIAKVPPILHTPLMSGANAISGITIVGSLAAAGAGAGAAAAILGMLAVVLATVNVVGGFLVTDRMLAMFGSRRDRPDRPDQTDQTDQADGAALAARPDPSDQRDRATGPDGPTPGSAGQDRPV